MSIKDLVKGDKVVSFVKYGNGVLHYSTDCGFIFPVPVSDIGDATFLANDRAMLFMRYLRKQIDACGGVVVRDAGTVTSDASGDVKFSHYKGGELWYVTECGFEFPVSIVGYGGEISAAGSADSFASYIASHREFLASSFRETIEA